MPTAEWVWKNGEFVKYDDATVHVSAHAIHYGSSVFEGERAYATPDGPAIFRLKEHTRRLVNSAKIVRIELPYTEDELNRATIDTVRQNGHESCYIRPVVFRGAHPNGLQGLEGRTTPTDVAIITMEWGKYLGDEAMEQGVDVQVSSWRRMTPGALTPMGKIGGQYINSQYITMEARDNGFNEGIALDANGLVSEGAGENLFVIQDGVVYTPGIGSSILMGITRDSALTILNDLGYEVKYMALPREMLYVADEIFFTGTAAEITPVRSVDRIEIGSGSRGPITKQVQDMFFGITSGELPDKFGWLTHVNQPEKASS
ncbi:MAG: branched-chain amino acid transaminase [Chloroflexota bacterium]